MLIRVDTLEHFFPVVDHGVVAGHAVVGRVHGEEKVLDAQQVFVDVVIGIHAHNETAVGVSNADIASCGKANLPLQIDHPDPAPERVQNTGGVISAAVVDHQDLVVVSGHALLQKTANGAPNTMFAVVHCDDYCDLHETSGAQNLNMGSARGESVRVA